MSLATLQADAPLRLWYDKPASVWTEALPIGNGRLGGMLFGSPDKEHLQFNEQRFWTGDETEMGAYQPFGDLFLDAPLTNVTNYHRELDLGEAFHRSRFTSNGVHYLREAFSSDPDQVIVIRLSADKPGAISGSLRLNDAHTASIVASGNTPVSRGSLPNHLDCQAPSDRP